MDDKFKPTIFIADPDCPICHGTGIMCIPNGPDDYDREVCEECNGTGYIDIEPDRKAQVHNPDYEGVEN